MNDTDPPLEVQLGPLVWVVAETMSVDMLVHVLQRSNFPTGVSMHFRGKVYDFETEREIDAFVRGINVGWTSK